MLNEIINRTQKGKIQTQIISELSWDDFFDIFFFFSKQQVSCLLQKTLVLEPVLSLDLLFDGTFEFPDLEEGAPGSLSGLVILQRESSVVLTMF